MKIKVTKKTRGIVIGYVAVVALLYFGIFVIPQMTDAFETTQTLENGSLEVSADVTGYIVKDEAVCTATVRGKPEYKLVEETVVKKGTPIVKITPEKPKKDEKEGGSKYSEYLRRLKGYSLLVETDKAPISGVFTTSIDGWEKYFAIDNLDKLTREKTEERFTNQFDLGKSSILKGDPLFKISSDDKWYIVTWMTKEDRDKFSEGEEVRIEIDDSNLDARIERVKKEGDWYKVIFYLNVYYEDFSSARRVEMNVVQSNTVGLIVDNECIVTKNGQQGLYVKSKDGEVSFKPIKVKITDGTRSVIYDTVYTDENYEQVETVSVYQEVLRDPQDELEADMRDDKED